MNNSIRNVFFCNNSYQVLVAIRIVLDKYKNDDNVLFLSDDIVNSEYLKELAKRTHLFREIIVIKAKGCILRKRDIKYKLIRARCEFCSCHLIMNSFDTFSKMRIFLNGPRCYIENFVRHLHIKDSEIEINLFEEGYSSYTNMYRDALYRYGLLEKIIRFLSELMLGKQHIDKLAKNFYLFEPELLCWKPKLNLIKIEKSITDEEYLNILGFSLKDFEIENSLLFLEEAFWIDFNENDDIKLIEKLYNNCSLKKMIIRLHPRSPYNRFAKFGYIVMPTSEIPWEILLMLKYRNSTLITMSSGAAINSRLIFSLDTNVVLLYKCITNTHMNESTVKEWFEKFENKYKKNVYIPNSLNEISEFLKEKYGN